MRYYQPITDDVLRHLRDIALKEWQAFFQKHQQKYSAYASQKNLIAIALCQGAALHFIDGKNGVKDFDVWLFYKQNPGYWRYPVKRPSGLPQFGNTHVDLLSRELGVELVQRCNRDPARCLREWLTTAPTESARHLAKKAVVGLHPDSILGQVIWSTLKCMFFKL